METKIQLSEEESNLVADASLLLTKNRVMAKMHAYLGEVSTMSAQLFNAESVLQAGTGNWRTPKISRGENYGGLPYLVLDQPRLFSASDIFALRTMFWWGRYFSVTLHLKGFYQAMFVEELRKNAALLASRGYQWSMGGEEWKHELEAPFYEPVSADGNAGSWQAKREADFLKVAVSVPLLPLDRAFADIASHHRLLAGILGFSYQGDEKVL